MKSKMGIVDVNGERHTSEAHAYAVGKLAQQPGAKATVDTRRISVR